MVKFIATEGRNSGSLGLGTRGNGELFNGFRVSVLQDEKFLEIGCTIM